MEQITIFDFIQQEKDTSCRWLKDGDDDLIGKVIPFRDLKKYIGKKVVVSCVNSGYRIVRIFDYHENCNTIYKRVRPLPDNDIGYGEYVNEYIHDVCGIKECMACYEPYMTFDGVSYSDTDRNRKANCSIAEYYCTGGRWNMIGTFLETFHELNV
jgi:hypothetical protein